MKSSTLFPFLILGILCACAEHKPDTPAPPNILFILADDLGLTDINSFDPLNRSYYETPHIDRLGEEGMRFLRAYTNAANCAPTRAAIESGQYYPNQPIYHVGNSGRGAMIPVENAHHLPLEKITAAEMLQQAGYTTALMGKWHLGFAPEFGPQQQGYDINIGGNGEGHPGRWDGSYFEPNNNPLIGDARDGEYLTDYLTRKAISFIESHQSEPFYLNLSYYTPHFPIEAPEDVVKKYEKKTPDRGHANPTYAAMIEVLDTNVGRLLAALDELGIADNTLVVFFSDNGGSGGYGYLGYGDRDITVNTPLKGGKGTFYEGGIRVPMIVRWPRMIEPGTTSNESVMGIDLYPTYLGIAGIEKPAGYHLDGVNLTSLFKNPEASLNRDALFWHFPGYPNSAWRSTPVSVVRSGPWKLMRFYETEEVQLYNVEEDIGEQVNLAELNPEKREALKNALDEWLVETHAPFPQWADDR